MKKFRHLYIGMDVCGTDSDHDSMECLIRYCRKSFNDENYEDIAKSIDDMCSDFIIRQDVLDTPLVRSLLLEEYAKV